MGNPLLMIIRQVTQQLCKCVISGLCIVPALTGLY